MENVYDSNQQQQSNTQQAQTQTGRVPPPWVQAEQTQTEDSSVQPQQEKRSSPQKQKPDPQDLVKKSPFKSVALVIILLLLGIGFYFLAAKVVLPLVQQRRGDAGGGDLENVVLEYWGLWEPNEVLSALISEYQDKNPHVTVNYKQQSSQDYRERLQSAFAQDKGPDIFRFHNTWIPMLQKELSAMTQEIEKEIDLSKNFFPSVSNSLKVNGKSFGVPLGFDCLLLYYNPQILREANKTYPNSWDEMRKTAADITVYDDQGRIEIAGAALGTSSNIDHFSDILGLMMLQNGVDLKDPTGSLAEDALKFYTLFSSRDKVWNDTLPSSVYSFANEKVAMIFAPSWRAHQIKELNPDLEFKTAPVPQLPGSQIGWATFWAEGVSEKSSSAEEAWRFLSFLSSKESLTKLYTQASQVRDFGEPYPRKDLATELENDSIVGAVVTQGPYAESWYLCSRTHDNGINDKLIKYFQDAVGKVIQGTSSSKALETVAQGVSQVLKQYGVE